MKKGFRVKCELWAWTQKIVVRKRSEEGDLWRQIIEGRATILNSSQRNEKSGLGRQERQWRRGHGLRRQRECTVTPPSCVVDRLQLSQRWAFVPELDQVNGLSGDLSSPFKSLKLLCKQPFSWGYVSSSPPFTKLIKVSSTCTCLNPRVANEPVCQTPADFNIDHFRRRRKSVGDFQERAAVTTRIEKLWTVSVSLFGLIPH